MAPRRDGRLNVLTARGTYDVPDVPLDSSPHPNLDALGPKPRLITYEVMTFMMIGGVLLSLAGLAVIVFAFAVRLFRSVDY